MAQSTKRQTGKASNKPPQRAYYSDYIDPSDVEAALERNPDLVEFSNLSKLAKLNAIRRFKRTQALNQEAVDNLLRLLKAGAPVLYNTRKNRIEIPISASKVRSTGHSNVTISTNLITEGGLEAAASIYLAHLQESYTPEELAAFQEEQRAEQEAAAKMSQAELEALDNEEYKHWLRMESKAKDGKATIAKAEKARKTGKAYQEA